MPITAGLVRLWFVSTAECGMAKSRICGRLALYQDRILSRALKASVAASNVALKPNSEHLEHN